MLLLLSTASVIFRYFIAGAGFQNANKEWKPYLNCFNTSYSNSYTNCTTSISSVLVETFISNNIINYKWVFLKTQITLKVIFSNSLFKSTFKISSCGHIHFIHNIVRLTTPLSLAIPPLPSHWYNIMYSIKAKYAIVRLSFCIITPFSCGRQVVVCNRHEFHPALRTRQLDLIRFRNGSDFYEITRGPARKYFRALQYCVAAVIRFIRFSEITHYVVNMQYLKL